MNTQRKDACVSHGIYIEKVNILCILFGLNFNIGENKNNGVIIELKMGKRIVRLSNGKADQVLGLEHDVIF